MMEGQTEGQTDRQMSQNSPLCPTGHRPFGAAAQKGHEQGRIHGHQLRTGGQGRKCAFSLFSTRAHQRTNGPHVNIAILSDLAMEITGSMTNGSIPKYQPITSFYM